MRILAPGACSAGRLAIAFALALPLVRPGTARAQAAADLAGAEKAFDQALADERAGAYDRAAEELAQARTLAHKETPQLLFHLGVCHARLGKAVLARDELQRAAAAAKAQGLTNVQTTAEAQLAEVQPQIASLALTPPARGHVTAVDIDGADVTSKLGVAIDLDPGAHRVHVTFDGAAPFDRSVTLGDGERRALPIPEPTTSTSTPTSTSTSTSTPTSTSTLTSDTSPSSSSRTPAWILLGTGAALLAGGTVLWILRDGDVSTLTGDCGSTQHGCPAQDQSVIDRGKLEDTLGVALFAAGGVAALAGAGWLLFGGSHGAPATGLHLTPVLTARGAGLGVSGGIW